MTNFCHGRVSLLQTLIWLLYAAPPSTYNIIIKFSGFAWGGGLLGLSVSFTTFQIIGDVSKSEANL